MAEQRPVFWRCLWCDDRGLLESSQESLWRCPSCDTRGVVTIWVDPEEGPGPTIKIHDPFTPEAGE